MAINLSPASFVIDLKGDATGEAYQGNFSVKRFLSQRDRIQKDGVRRNLLGLDADQASVDAAIRAEMLSHLSVSISDSPTWWKESNAGLDLYDDNVVVELYKKTAEAQQAEMKEVSKKGEEAHKELRKKRNEKKETEEE